jgi:threonine/homoserine/homoserine lactone efflux protein
VSASVLASLALYAFVTSITPGPNNLMLASSGLTFGFRRTLPHIVGVAGGFFTLIAVAGLGLGAVFQAEPRLQIALRVIGAAYLLHLAWKLWRAGELKDRRGGEPLGVWSAAAFQFVNPKGVVMAITAVSAFAASGQGYGWRVLAVCLTFLLVGAPCMSSWALFGSAARRVLSEPRAIRWFNRIMAALTAATALLILI